MTAIAYRDGTMAADTMMLPDDDNVKVLNDVKVVKRKGHLFGISGDACPPTTDFVKWFFSKARGKPWTAGLSFKAMVVDPSGSITLWDETGTATPLKEKYWAVGSGKEFAIGAMDKGASAHEAVRVAIKRSPSVGGKVMSRSFQRKRKNDVEGKEGAA
jgi:hypothetical protein